MDFFCNSLLCNKLLFVIDTLPHCSTSFILLQIFFVAGVLSDFICRKFFQFSFYCIYNIFHKNYSYKYLIVFRIESQLYCACDLFYIPFLFIATYKFNKKSLNIYNKNSNKDIFNLDFYNANNFGKCRNKANFRNNSS